MRRVALAVLAAALAAAGALLGVACGYEGTGTASPETVVGTVAAPTGTGPALPALPQGTAAAGKSVFATAGCTSCHTLKAASSTGTVGPNLDQAMPDVTLVEDRVYFGKNAMPSFKSSLSLQQMADVAAYVYSSTHGGAAPPATSQTTETTATATTGTETTGTTTEATQTTPTETTATETTATATTATETAPTETTGGGNAEAGKAIFMSAGCTGCHTLQAANSHGTVGPNLDDAKPPASLVVDRVTNGKGGMPSFKDQLTPQQIQDVAAFVSQSTGG